MTFGLEETKPESSIVRIHGQIGIGGLKFGSKVWPTGPGAHAAENLGRVLRQSLAALKAQKVGIFYLHAPDRTSSFEETAKAYNPIARSVIPELLPYLKNLDISFYAYKGLLSGRYKFDDDVIEGGRYDPKVWIELLVGVQILNKAAKANNLTLIEATLRWMKHHSGLEARDGIVIGVSSLKHLEENLVDLEKGPLPQAMIDVFNQAWDHVMPASRHYLRAA
ncbi:Aflatoxin B1 aldehyde reductase member 2 [Modicella reniformis]|uniref:Aflatoxin B1 aldehyde reductase member 2 n=1 Tax=Modicella reniformis TaxID=1440133 RepID=A0A9P6MK72_9FUNG|nr:Aflatoxin B1 aldehyde reductase member 2 [Modicella reniformis]